MGTVTPAARTRARSKKVKLSGAGMVVGTGKAAEAVQQAETRLKHKAILGAVVQGRDGLRSLTSSQYKSASGREGKAGTDAGGGASFNRGRRNQRSSGHEAERCLDEAGVSRGS